MLIILIQALICITSASSLKINCDYKFSSWTTFERSFICDVANDPKIIEENTKIDEVNKVEPVVGFSISYKTCHFFPQNIDKFFKNLTILEIHSTDLQEIKQHDLKPFTKLKGLFLSNNSIHIIEKNIFKFNPDLQVIWLNMNPLKYMNPNVFDHLIGIKSLNFVGGVYSMGYALTPETVPMTILHMKEIFSFPSVLWTDNQELTNELHKAKLLFEISAVFNVLMILVLLWMFASWIVVKCKRNNRVGHDESKTSFSFFEMSSIRERLQTCNFN
ncbi:unnamed protein product [Chironomus riparius]|uniref:Uncharacterized protein n=1 Tax=Chironomus riparius TaxID=315576 RepID=A0A9N9SAM6_9DIPT|nr:unnamed protein product [Chironomus riparius]